MLVDKSFFKQKINFRDGFSILQLKTVGLRKVGRTVWSLLCTAVGARVMEGRGMMREQALQSGRLGKVAVSESLFLLCEM